MLEPHTSPLPLKHRRPVWREPRGSTSTTQGWGGTAAGDPAPSLGRGARPRALPGPRPRPSPGSPPSTSPSGRGERKLRRAGESARPEAPAPGAPLARSLRRRRAVPALPPRRAGEIRRPRARRGRRQHRPRGPGRGRWEACARRRRRRLPRAAAGAERGSSALPGPGQELRCSLLKACRRGPSSPAAAASGAGAGPTVSPPGSGECPAPRSPVPGTALPTPPF